MATLLNHGEPQNLELFKNTLPSKLYWIQFSISNLRDAVDAVERVLAKKKIEIQLSGQSSSTTTPFMKVGDIHHLNKTVSYNAHDPVRKQLESLTSMVYNMSIHKEDNNRPFKPQIHQKKEEDKTDRILVIETETDHSVWTDKDKTLRPNHRRQSQDRHTQCGNDSRRGSYRCQNNDNRNDSRHRGRQNFRRNLGNDRYDNRDRSRTRQRSLTPRRDDNRRV